MLEYIAKGFIIGLMVSSPMGPINMLVIQRTLSRGRIHGLVTGMGSMLSDLIYASLTMTAVGLVSRFLTQYEFWFQLIGGVVLILFGWFVFRSNPMKGLQPTVMTDGSRLFRSFLSSFLLTFSNVGIIVVLMGLYSRFAFNPLSEGLPYFIAAVASFAVAALSWWLFLTFFVAYLRKHFNRRGLVLLNRIVGVIFMIIGVGGVLFSLFGLLS